MHFLAQIGEWFDRRLQLAAPIREVAEHPVPRNTASWWYVFGSAALTVFILQLVTGILLALDLRPVGQRGVEQSAGFEPRRNSRVVHPRDARMGLEFHGGNCPDSHGPGVSLWSLQISAGAYLDCRRFPSAHDAGHGLQRAGSAVRSGRVLGTRNRRLNREPRPCSRSRDREVDARRADHRWCHAFPILCAARIRNSGNVDRLRVHSIS